MTAGVPGTGIGGLFYLISALLLPLRGLWRRRRRASTASWGEILKAAGLAAGVLLGIWLTGWLLGLLLGPTPQVARTALGRRIAQLGHRENIVRGAALAAGFITLALVLLSVQAARFWTRRKNRMKPRIPAALLAAIILVLAAPLAGQTPVRDLIKKAKAAVEAENPDLARDLYRQALALDTDESEPYYRLGELSRIPEDAVLWFSRYVEREPGDAWGWLALGSALVKARRPLEARDAYRKAATLEPEAEDILGGLVLAKKAVDGGFMPIGRYEFDSDTNNIWSYGAEGSFPLRGGFRLGGRYVHTGVRGQFLRAGVDDYSLQLEARPRSTTVLSASFGLARFDVVDPSKGAPPTLAARIINESTPWQTLTGELRIRFRVAGGGPAVDARVQRLARYSSPLLVFNHVVQDDIRLIGELPAGPLRLRALGRISLIEALDEPVNTRLEGGAAVVLPLGWRGEVSVQYHRLGYARSPDIGYFAPRMVETVEAGTYWELGGEGNWTAGLDLGAGIQHLARQGEAAGSWKPALRGWAFFSYDFSAALQARLEMEAYSAPFAPVGAVLAENWQSLSINAGLRLRF
jgi:tetratricopeptide (TPR) repeat protein